MAIQRALDWLTASSVLNWISCTQRYEASCSWNYNRNSQYAPVPEWLFEE